MVWGKVQFFLLHCSVSILTHFLSDWENKELAATWEGPTLEPLVMQMMSPFLLQPDKDSRPCWTSVKISLLLIPCCSVLILCQQRAKQSVFSSQERDLLSKYWMWSWMVTFCPGWPLPSILAISSLLNWTSLSSHLRPELTFYAREQHYLTRSTKSCSNLASMSPDWSSIFWVYTPLLCMAQLYGS